MSEEHRRQLRSEIGVRLRAARRTAGLSQKQLAEALGIPQRTVSFYERGEGDLPSSLLVPLADVLDVGVHELLCPPKGHSAPNEAGGPARPGASRRAGISRPGPKSMIEKRVEALRELPRKDQQFVVKFLDQVLGDYQRRRRK